jgi:inorganic pyrophosphatase
MPAPIDLKPFDPETGLLNVVIETPQNSSGKFKYDEEKGLFVLDKSLPLGMMFPFDFGFVPSTRGDDGDPVDVLVLMNEKTFPGTLLPARLIGVIEAEQTNDGKTERNDRLLAVFACSTDYRDVHSLNDLPDRMLADVEHFFMTYHKETGSKFKPVGRRGPRHAVKLIEDGEKRFRGQPSPNGAAKSSKRKTTAGGK